VSVYGRICESDKTEAGAKAAGFASQFSTFHAYFNLASLLKIFTAVGTVNQALQAATLHLQQCNKLIQNLKALLQRSI
jgi:hypothetical protein